MKYVKTAEPIETVLVPNLDLLQKQYLVDNILDAMDVVRKSDIKKSIVVEAPTGSGKSFAITNHTILAIAKKFSDITDIFFLAPAQECIDEPYQTTKKFDNKIMDGKLVRVYKGDELKESILRDRDILGDIRFYFMTTQYYYEIYKRFYLSGGNAQPLIFPDLIINDEAHHGLGVPDASTTKEDKGVKIKNFNPKWFDLQNAMMKLGTTVIHMTATPTQSQRMKTISGNLSYLQLAAMPKRKVANTFTKFHYHGNVNNLYETWGAAKKTFTKLVRETILQQNHITDATWGKVNGTIHKMMPATIVSLGRSNAVNGIQIDDVIDEIRDYAKGIGAIVFVSTSDEKEFDYVPIDRMSDGIDRANSSQYVNRPLIMVVIDSGKEGINIARMNLAVVCKVPSQQKVENNQVQFVARTGRLPWGAKLRDHDMAIEYFKSLDISDDQKRALVDYYCLMSTSFVIVPDDTEIMVKTKDAFTKETFTMEEGIDYMMKGVFGEDDPKQLVSGLTAVIKPDVFNRLYRKDHCEVCEDQRCYHDAVAGYNKQYGANHFTVEDFVMNWMKSLHVDHIDGNRYNNDPSNHVTVCPNVHSLKTQLNEDFRNIYEVEA
jgi:hypothetical protein